MQNSNTQHTDLDLARPQPPVDTSSNHRDCRLRCILDRKTYFYLLNLVPLPNIEFLCA